MSRPRECGAQNVINFPAWVSEHQPDLGYETRRCEIDAMIADGQRELDEVLRELEARPKGSSLRATDPPTPTFAELSESVWTLLPPEYQALCDRSAPAQRADGRCPSI
jgi:hypothetical protein